ncbi:MAG TPA: DUF2779 domain-containing protein [Candidatus Krumholzibacteria bacterium]|nr:DUF2779 domain-containing protein [Candidatus Krumholzibacteria bacterium]
MSRPLGKSRYLDGLQCPKLMWVRLHARDRIPAAEPWQEQLAGASRQLGDLAKQLWEGGVEVPPFRDPGEQAKATQKLLPRRVPIYEACFEAEGRTCRVDVLEPAPAGRWDVIKVKGGARVRNTHVQELAFIRDTLLHAGVEIDRIWIMHVNTDYVRGEHLHPHELFKRVDVTERVLRVGPYVDRTVVSLKAVAAGAEPDTPIGPHCNDPHPCRLIPQCWAGLPEDNVTDLHRAGREAFAFMDQGIFRIRDIPDAKLSVNQRIQKQAVVTGEVQVDRDAVRRWLGGLSWPLWFLDFETMAPAIPTEPGLRPYQQVPFQYSLHVLDAPDAKLRHHEFLHVDAGDPRPCLLRALVDNLGPQGSVVTWNADSEKLVLGDLAAFKPKHAAWLEAVALRLVDLADPWRTFAVHHPGQHGSTSLKAVLPTVTTLQHNELSISSGAQATYAYEAIRLAAAPPAERESVFRDLRRYCALDTLAMVELWRWLQGVAR